MAKKNRTAGNKAGNKKRARGKSTMKDLELPSRKAEGVKGGAKGGAIPLIRSPYNPYKPL